MVKTHDCPCMFIHSYPALNQWTQVDVSVAQRCEIHCSVWRKSTTVCCMTSWHHGALYDLLKQRVINLEVTSSRLTTEAQMFMLWLMLCKNMLRKPSSKFGQKSPFGIPMPWVGNLGCPGLVSIFSVHPRRHRYTNRMQNVRNMCIIVFGLRVCLPMPRVQLCSQPKQLPIQTE